MSDCKFFFLKISNSFKSPLVSLTGHLQDTYRNTPLYIYIPVSTSLKGHLQDTDTHLRGI